jgi:phosphoglycerate dehydrogenase-like enzyme
VTVVVAIYSRVAVWNLPSQYLDRLRRAFPQHRFLHARNHSETLALAPEAEVMFASNLRPAHVTAAGRLRWIHTPVAGVGHLLFPELAGSDIIFTNARGMSSRTIAEHVVAVTLAMYRKLPQAFRAQQARQWAQDAIATPPACRMIAGSAALVVGLGAIGLAVAQALSALGARVDGVKRRRPDACPPGIEAVHTPDRLRDRLPYADLVVIAAPETADTRHLMGAAELAAMRRSALLVNVSRGAIVDEAALVAALAADTIGGAALDVFEQEPLPSDHALWTLPNVLITPHTSGSRPDHWDAAVAMFADNLRRFEAGAPLLNVVDKKAGY